VFHSEPASRSQLAPVAATERKFESGASPASKIGLDHRQDCQVLVALPIAGFYAPLGTRRVKSQITLVRLFPHREAVPALTTDVADRFATVHLRRQVIVTQILPASPVSQVTLGMTQSVTVHGPAEQTESPVERWAHLDIIGSQASTRQPQLGYVRQRTR
jgi:hypothetical protein